MTTLYIPENIPGILNIPSLVIVSAALAEPKFGGQKQKMAFELMFFIIFRGIQGVVVNLFVLPKSIVRAAKNRDYHLKSH